MRSQSDGQRGNSAYTVGTITIPTHAIARKRVLITGAGGSIGSAFAHAVSLHEPENVLLVEASEQALYRIDRELAAPRTPILADISDETAIDETFERHRPHIVLHAAAFKHVPLMELHPFEAMRNNSVGTFMLTQAAVRHGAKDVVIVSTDKAVNPASIMGVSKRIAELTALALASSATRIKAVRLGNVYGSQGSVVPLFQQQIAQGGPVTVTDPCATRYFLSMQQSVELLLLALSDELPSAILVPELADPTRIEELARDLIQQSKSRVGIIYTGLRPGEKRHEQLLSKDESFLDDIPAPLRAIRSKQISAKEAAQVIGELQSAICARSLDHLLRTIVRLVPSYRPSETLLAEQPTAGRRA